MWLTLNHTIFFINYDHRVRTAAKWVRMLHFWSHLSVQGYCSLSPNKADAGFPAETTILFSKEFSFWGVDDKKDLRNKKCYELRRHVTDALLRSLNLQLLPQYFFCWVRYVKEEVWRKLSWKRQLYLFWFGPIPAKWNQTMRISKLPLFCHDGVSMEILTFPFLYAYEISRALQACALILPLCIMGCFCVVQLLLLY